MLIGFSTDQAGKDAVAQYIIKDQSSSDGAYIAMASFPSTSRNILLMPTLGVDLCTCSTAMMDGDLISLIRFLLMKLDTSSMLLMNSPLIASATH